MIKVSISKQSRIFQGDIFKDVEYIEYAIEKEGIIEFSKITFPLVVVLTQDCDLSQDFRVRWSRKFKLNNHDKKLLSVIVAPLYNCEHVYSGNHLSELDMIMSPINREKTEGRYLKQNKLPRYHYLEFPKHIQIVPSVVDFKHYFTVNVEYLKIHKKDNFICKVESLYREDLSQRFSSFLSRIGLPPRPTKK